MNKMNLRKTVTGGRTAGGLGPAAGDFEPDRPTDVPGP
jgi:hypothetical protein